MASRFLASVAFFASGLPSLAQTALPTAPVVAAGSVAISAPSATSVLVTQSSRNAVINWGGFSVGAGNSVRFENGSGATLNRVTGFSPSQIDGSLTASGSLFLVNPNGVTIGPTGNVVTGGSFVASTHDVADSEFMAGGAMTFKGSSTSSVINYGTIGSLGGDVALIARKVENAGTITAPQGTAALAAGYEILVRDGALSDGKFVVKVGGADAEAKTSGVIKAAEIELKANGGNVYALAGNTASLSKATGIATSGGRVFLTAGTGGKVTVTQKVSAKRANGKGGEINVSGGKVKVSGTLDAAGDWGAGGAIVVTARDIALASGAVLDASGATGGVVLVGGDYQGGKDAARKYVAQDIATAETTTVDAGAVIRADGTAGAGGRVVVWSDAATSFAGTISATGAGTGAGGDAEVSGKATLAFTGTADLTSASGVFGTLLLDPYNLTIYDGADGGVMGPPNVTALGEDAYLNVGTLQNALENANVSVSTSGSAGTGTEEGNIVIAVPVSWSADTTLTLSAAGNVIFNAAVTATGESAGLVIEYGTGKDYIVNAPITLSGASATLQIGATGALQSYTLIHSMAALDAIDTTGLSGRYALVQDLSASGTYTNALVTGSFTGTFAGLGHTISNLVINAPTTDNIGLFANAASGSTLRNVSLVGGSVTGKGSVGALAGVSAGRVSNVSSNLSVVGSDSFVGGLVGLNSSGGAGIWDSSSSGSVSGVDNVGGIAGNSQASITRSYATGAVTGANYVGGIAGITGDNVSGSYATGAVTATGDYVGGLVGANGATVQNSYATGAVTGGSKTGGLVGANYGLIQRSYALGSVTGTTSVGGLVGSDESATIDTAYASGAVTGTSAVGGLVGTAGGWSTIIAAYWDKDTSGQAHSSGSDDSFGLTTAQARQSSSYSDWDFDTVWYQTADMRPILRAEAASAVNGVITITNLHQLALMGANLSGSYVLAGDIDASATAGTNAADIWSTQGWAPVGISSSVAFTGAFDGDGYTLSSLTINRPSTSRVGLFGYAGATSSITNVTLSGGSVVGEGEIGALVGTNAGTISNVSSSVAVSGSSNIGGLVGMLNGGSISASHASGTVEGEYAGGLVGATSGGTISDSSASGNVSGPSVVGGLVGFLFGGTTVSNSHATGDVEGSSVGGLIGWLENASVTGSYATGTVTGGGYAGGLVGESVNGSISQSYAGGDVSGGDRVGGLAGSVSGTSITQSYASGAVSGGLDVGGLVGTLDGGIIQLSYALGSVTGSTENVGGLVGNAAQGSISQTYASGAVSASGSGANLGTFGGLIGNNGGATVTLSYWDTGTTGQSSGVGTGSADGVTGLTTAEARTESSYAGWDFSDDWYLIEGETRPFLRSEWSTTIVNAHQLQLMTLNLGASYTLGANIDLSVTQQPSQMWNTASGFSPIGDLSSAFTGTFDGAGHTISNLFVDRSAYANSYAGLFGNSSGTSVIRNVGLASGTVTGSDVAAGGLVGNNAGTVQNVFSNVGVTGENGVGSLIGSNSGSISVAFATGNVTLTGGSPQYGGGLVGINTGSIADAFAIGNVTGGNVIGGLVGLNSGSIDRTFALGAVSAPGPVAGALVGTNNGTIAASYWRMGLTPGVALGSGTVTTSGDLTIAEFMDTAFFVSTASAAGWNFDTTWAPPSSGYIPDLYALTPIVWVKTVSSTSTYGDTTATTTSSTSVGGPSSYVFGPAGDTIALTGRTIDIASTTSAGTSTIATNQNQSALSASGVSYRLFYYGTDTATVAKATLTVTADNGTMVYGDAVPTIGYTATGWKNGQTGSLLTGVSVSTDATSTSNAGSGYATTAAGGTLSGAADGNYTISYVQGTFSVTPRFVTVTADNQSMTAGSAVPPLTYVLSSGSLVNGDGFSGGLTTSATSGSAAGLYPILQGTLSLSSNYAVTYRPGELIVTGSNQAILVPPSLFVPQPATDQALATETTFALIVDSEADQQQTGNSQSADGAVNSGSCESGTACATEPHPDNRSFGRWLTFRTQ